MTKLQKLYKANDLVLELKKLVKAVLKNKETGKNA